MARLLLSLLLISTLANCGRSTQNTSRQATAPTTPTDGGTVPATPNSPSAPSTPTSSLKWTEKELSENSNACAEAGAGEYSYQAWKIFCRCTYEAAARRWTFSYFNDNFESSYDELFNEGVIHQCLQKANIDIN